MRGKVWDMMFVKRLVFWDASWDNRGGQVAP